MRQIQPHRDEIQRWVYQRIADVCRSQGAVPVWVFVPSLGGDNPTSFEFLANLAIESGFEAIDLRGCFDGADVNSLSLATWDLHPGVRGHQLIADRLFAELRSRHKLLVPRAPEGVQESEGAADVP
jgi:hypothetical protein